MDDILKVWEIDVNMIYERNWLWVTFRRFALWWIFSLNELPIFCVILKNKSFPNSWNELYVIYFAFKKPSICVKISNATSFIILFTVNCFRMICMWCKIKKRSERNSFQRVSVEYIVVSSFCECVFYQYCMRKIWSTWKWNVNDTTAHVSPSRIRIALHSSRLLYRARAISIDIGADSRFLQRKNCNVEFMQIQCAYLTGASI